MARRRLSTTNYDEQSRVRLGDAVMKARVAASIPSRTMLAARAEVSLRSIDKLEQGEAGVGARVLYGVGRVLPNWSEDTPRVILEGGPIPALQVPEPQKPEPEPEPDPILEEIRYFRRLLGRDDLDRMFRLFDAINESNRRFDDELSKAERDGLEDAS